MPVDRRAAARDTLAAILGVTSFILILDATVFRGTLSHEYVAFYTGPLVPRVWAISLLAATEEVKFRLVLMTAPAMLATWLTGRLTPSSAIAIILLAQFANVGHLVLADPLYATLRFWLVGSVWGWLYWRHGWLAALIGHAATHPLLDPLLLLILSH